MAKVKLDGYSRQLIILLTVPVLTETQASAPKSDTEQILSSSVHLYSQHINIILFAALRTVGFPHQNSVCMSCLPMCPHYELYHCAYLHHGHEGWAAHFRVPSVDSYCYGCRLAASRSGTVL